MTIRVLIVDDSPTMRALIAELMRRESDITVVGMAADAVEARSMIREREPDVVTLDLEMPGMSGLDFLDKLMRLRPLPVVVVSGHTREGADVTARALEIGAIDCYAKPDGRAGNLLHQDAGRLANLVRIAAQARLQNRPQDPSRKSAKANPIAPRGALPEMIAVGSSTGGVEALQILLQGFPADCPPTLIVQHINGHFAEAVARRLNTQCAPTVTCAEPDLPLRQGHVYLAPGSDRHLQVRKGTHGLFARMRPGEKVSGHRPSVDMLFHSAAEEIGAQAVGILLTGMGQDGAHGLLAMARAGAATIAQDEATSTVFGMPRAAIGLGAAKIVAPIHRIAEHAFSRAA
ncbi:MAG: chemotaxis response regulator protein-glutamate methylesterase [Sphingomonas sp.]|jgi:two-component system chemotaxis response regulator CheB